MPATASIRVPGWIDPDHPGPAHQLARTLEAFAHHRDQAEPRRTGEEMAEITILDEHGNRAGRFYLTGGDVHEIHRAFASGDRPDMPKEAL